MAGNLFPGFQAPTMEAPKGPSGFETALANIPSILAGFVPVGSKLAGPAQALGSLFSSTQAYDANREMSEFTNKMRLGALAAVQDPQSYPGGNPWLTLPQEFEQSKKMALLPRVSEMARLARARTDQAGQDATQIRSQMAQYGVPDQQIADAVMDARRQSTERTQMDVRGIWEEALQDYTNRLLQVGGAKMQVAAGNQDLATNRLGLLAGIATGGYDFANPAGVSASVASAIGSAQDRYLEMENIRAQERIANKQAQTAIATGGMSSLAGLGSAAITSQGNVQAANILAPAMRR